MKKNALWQCPAEKISRRLFYVLIALAVVIYGLFAFVGYDRPSLENPDFKAPLFTDLLLCLVYLLLLIAIIVGIWSAAKAYRSSKGEATIVNGIHQRRIALCVTLGTVGVTLLTLLLGSTAPLTINGKPYTDAWDLRVADMFIYTSGLLLVAALAAVIFGATRYNRKKEGKQP